MKRPACRAKRDGERRHRLGAAALAATLALTTGCRTTADMQRDYARTLRPADIEAPPDATAAAPAPAVRTFRVRLYADAGYQRQTLRWREKLVAQLERANRVLEPLFGVRLSAESVRAWESGEGSGNLATALASLAAVDPGGDVDWVFGFVPASESIAVADPLLGMAFQFGRHVVLRAMHSREERNAMEASLDHLSVAERDAVVHERMLHRETAVLLHEWAHTLGAFHERAPEWLMSPRYGTRESRFSAESTALVRLGLRHRDARDPAARAEWARAYRDTVARTDAAWDGATRDGALAAANAFFGPGDAATPARPAAAASSERDRACFAAVARSTRARETLAACRAAADGPDAGPEVLVALAMVLVDQRDRPGAARALVRAEPALEARGATPDTWLRVAQLYGEVEACSAAERLVARFASLPGADALRSECVRVRRQVGLASVSPALPADREAEYVAALREAERHVALARLDVAAERAARLERTFAGTPGAALVTCRVRAAGKDRGATRRTCEAAAAAAPDAPHPRRALGEIAIAERRWSDAAMHLRRAVELDDGDGEAWTRLALAYRRLGDAPALDALGVRYEARFGSTLQIPIR
jgi:tetratricopeptide (TPR) repeat protein